MAITVDANTLTWQKDIIKTLNDWRRYKNKAFEHGFVILDKLKRLPVGYAICLDSVIHLDGMHSKYYHFLTVFHKIQNDRWILYSDTSTVDKEEMSTELAHFYFRVAGREGHATKVRVVQMDIEEQIQKVRDIMWLKED